MSKQKKNQRNLEEKESTTCSAEPKLIKKLCASLPHETKEYFKDVSYSLTEDEKSNLKENQNDIMIKIENSNIQAFVQDQLTKFEPPDCENCPKRRADRVCVNKSCGNKYLQLICGKCHFDQHQNQKNKPEVDVDEFFIKLSTFLNSQKQENSSIGKSRIDTEKLVQVFDSINDIRQNLNSLKAKLSREIEGYLPPSEMHENLQKSMNKALSICEYEKVQEQLDKIKKSALYENNKFQWNDAFQKFSSFSKSNKELDGFTDQMNSIISKSFIDGQKIDLSGLKCLISPALSFGRLQVNDQKEFIAKDGEIHLQNYEFESQIYLDFQLNKTKKYNLRFSFEQQPISYVMVGVMPYSLVHSQWCYQIPNEYFCKRFYCPYPTHECSRILRGNDLNMCVTKGTKVDLRIDLENNQVQFTDYPDHNNINANHLNNKLNSADSYVFAFAFYQSQHIVIESLEEISSFEDI